MVVKNTRLPSLNLSSAAYLAVLVTSAAFRLEVMTVLATRLSWGLEVTPGETAPRAQ